MNTIKGGKADPSGSLEIQENEQNFSRRRKSKVKISRSRWILMHLAVIRIHYNLTGFNPIRVIIFHLLS